MRIFATLFMTALLALGAADARADSYWSHNGSLMRLSANGAARAFYYEEPRRGLAVSPGTLLFNGYRDGNRYYGTARVFSKYCPTRPLEYRVEGYVAPGSTRVVLRGSRPKHRRCEPTGEYVEDRLVFTYSHRD